MKGKIFTTSANVYQDQAKIIFDYYQKAAEQIVREEKEIEDEIEQQTRDYYEMVDQSKKAMQIAWILLGLAAVAIIASFVAVYEGYVSEPIFILPVLLLIPFGVYMSNAQKRKKDSESIDIQIESLNQNYQEIFRDYKVNKLGIAYVPIASQVKYENKSFIVDHTGTVSDSKVILQVSKQNETLAEKIADLEELMTEAPIVEGSSHVEEIDTESYSLSMQSLNQHDYFGKLDKTLRTISNCMSDIDITSVQLPLVEEGAHYLQMLKEYGARDLDPTDKVFEVFDSERHTPDISKFQELNKLKDSLSRDSGQFEDVLKGLMMNMASSVQLLSSLKVSSANKVVLESNKLLYKILKAPYNHYSPTLEANEIAKIKDEAFHYDESIHDYKPFNMRESSRVKFDLISEEWVAEDGKMTASPFGVHQIHQEIVAPIVQNLMEENRLERLRIYNNIQDQKINYLNQWHQDTEDFYGRNRAESANLINLMRASLREYIAGYNTLTSYQKTAENMQQGNTLDSTMVETQENTAESLALFQAQSGQFEQVQSNFEDYMEVLQNDINEKAQKFGHIDYYDAKLRDEHYKKVAVATEKSAEMDERRKDLVSVNPLFAMESTLPPLLNIEDLIHEHMSLNLPRIARHALDDLDGDTAATANVAPAGKEEIAE